MKTIISYALATIMCVSLSVSAKTTSKGDLDGKTYSITLTQSGKTTGSAWTTDEISFKSGMLHSTKMHDKERFDDAICDLNIQSNSSGKTMTFKAEKRNDAGDKVKWKGTVTGQNIKGTVEWTNKQGSHSYTFSGTAK